MVRINANVDDVHRHLSAAQLALIEWIATGDPREKSELLEVVRLFTAAEHLLSDLSKNRRDREISEQSSNDRSPENDTRGFDS